MHRMQGGNFRILARGTIFFFFFTFGFVSPSKSAAPRVSFTLSPLKRILSSPLKRLLCFLSFREAASEMQDPRMMNPRKQKSQRTVVSQVSEEYMRGLQEGSPALPLPIRSAQKASRKGMKNDMSVLYRPQERSKTSVQLESSNAGNDYMALRRKFLLLEGESCDLGTDLRVVEDEIKSLEDEKLELLDQLVVLEGLVDPSELHKQ
ncbi:Complement factor H-related protein 1 [Bienertia sinuspersici]